MDTDPGTGAFSTPGSGIRDPGWVKSQDPDPGWVKILIFFYADPGPGMETIQIRDPGSGIRDGKKSDPGSGINIPDPQHCMLKTECCEGAETGDRISMYHIFRTKVQDIKKRISLHIKKCLHYTVLLALKLPSFSCVLTVDTKNMKLEEKGCKKNIFIASNSNGRAPGA